MDSLLQCVGESFDKYASLWSNGSGFDSSTTGSNGVGSDVSDISKNNIPDPKTPNQMMMEKGADYPDVLLKIKKLTLNTEGIPLDILNMPATPGKTGKKRLLCVSPNTPVGKPGKELRYELMDCGSPELRNVNDGSDVKNHSVSDGLVENNHAIGGVVGDDSNDKQLPSINDLLMKRPIRCVSSSVGKTKNKRKKKAIKGGKQQLDVNQKLISDLMRQDLKEDDQN